MNYIELSNPRPFSKLFLYVDTYPNYVADMIFEDLGIHCKILTEYSNSLYPCYHVIIISVKKKDIEKFKLAMEKVKRKMLILGNKDYEEIADGIINMVVKGCENNGKPNSKRNRRIS